MLGFAGEVARAGLWLPERREQLLDALRRVPI
jgi:hypothetical protein